MPPTLTTNMISEESSEACNKDFKEFEVGHSRKTSPIQHSDIGLFKQLNLPLTVTRYHSLVVETESLPDCFEVTAWTQSSDGKFDEIMGFQHKTLPIEGVQFHPESIKTEQGHELLANFLRR